MKQKTEEPLLYRPTQAFSLTGMSRSKGYELIASGEWRAIRIGRTLRIPARALQEWIDRKLAESELEVRGSNYIDRK